MAAATAGKSQIIFWSGAACLAVGWLIVILEIALGMSVPLSLWFMLVSGCMGLASAVAQPTRPKLSQYFIFAMALTSLAGVVFIVILHP
jgi:hypothetical protein